MNKPIKVKSKSIWKSLFLVIQFPISILTDLMFWLVTIMNILDAVVVSLGPRPRNKFAQIICKIDINIPMIYGYECCAVLLVWRFVAEFDVWRRGCVARIESE